MGRRLVHLLWAWLALAAPALAAGPTQIVCLGDSLTAGYNLPADAAFPVVLEKALRARGLSVEVANAGVSGDTSAGGLERLDWSTPEGTDMVILELGANDMLRGLTPKIPRENLEAILRKLKARKIRVLLAGVLASPSMGREYKAEFDAIYPELAQKYAAPLYPFFLDGVIDAPGLIQADGLHPTRAGVEEIVRRIAPLVAQMAAAKAQ